MPPEQDHRSLTGQHVSEGPVEHGRGAERSGIHGGGELPAQLEVAVAARGNPTIISRVVGRDEACHTGLNGRSQQRLLGVDDDGARATDGRHDDVGAAEGVDEADVVRIGRYANLNAVTPAVLRLCGAAAWAGQNTNEDIGGGGEQLADDPMAEITGGSGDEDSGHDGVLFSAWVVCWSLLGVTSRGHGYHPKAMAMARPASTKDVGAMSLRSSRLFDARLGRTLRSR